MDLKEYRGDRGPSGSTGWALRKYKRYLGDKEKQAVPGAGDAGQAWQGERDGPAW